MMRRCAIALGALLLGLGVVVGIPAAADAHTIGLTGVPVCNTDGTWSVPVSVTITNTPSTGSDSQSEVKAINPASGLSAAGGSGVMSGNQVILNAWYEHRNNWPGVKARTGNYTEHYTINVPANQNSVTTMVQIDWKGWGSSDPTKTFTKPSDCGPDTSEQKINLCHATGSQSNPFVNIEVSKAAFYVGHRAHSGDIYPAGSYTKGGQSYSWSAQGDQSLLGTDCVKPTPPPTCENTPSLCPPPPPPPVCTTDCTPTPPPPPVNPPKPHHPKDKHVKTRVKVIDRCSCRKDDAFMFGNHNKVRIHKERVNRTTWKFTVTGKKVNGHQFLLPNKINGNHGWDISQVYTVHTTNKPCPCKVRGDCHKLYPHFNPVHNCVGRSARGGTVCH